MKKEGMVYLFLTVLAFISGYFFFRYSYKVSDSMPFAQEIIMIALGSIVTVLITALLLNKQSAVEIEKEQNIKYLDLKTRIYEGLLNLLESMSEKEKIEKSDLVKLQFVTHKLAIVASPQVLKEYGNLLNTISGAADDKSFANDIEKIGDAICRLSVQIRFDLLEQQPQSGNLNGELAQIIMQNTSKATKLEQNF